MSIPPHVQVRIQDLLNVAPVDIAAVAQRLELDIYAKTLPEGVSGMIVRDQSMGTPSGYVIYVDAEEAWVRQRFTAAHECGHFVLHRDKIGDGITDNYLLRSDQLSDRVEVQANKFAADLLMPYPLIARLRNEGYADVSSLARMLQVSEIAMGIRLGHPT